MTFNTNGIIATNKIIRLSGWTLKKLKGVLGDTPWIIRIQRESSKRKQMKSNAYKQKKENGITLVMITE